MQSNFPIGIYGLGSISPLGSDETEIKTSYLRGNSCVAEHEVGGRPQWVAALSDAAESELAKLVQSVSSYATLDRSVLFAILAARKALQMAGWEGDAANCAVSFGSSRGATGLFERYFRSFLESDSAKVSSRCSPTTTLGNLSSWVAQDLSLRGAALSHSNTCSTAIHAIANATAWIRAGMAERFLAGGSEAPLTAFTVAQMSAVGIYTSGSKDECACRPCAREPEGSFALGEGACCFALQRIEGELNRGPQRPLAIIESVGVGIEGISSPTSISANADGIRTAMEHALSSSASEGKIDAIVVHAPGTVKGDEAELKAIGQVFGENPPCLLSNKWMIGHTLGASGALSLEYALLLLRGMKPASPLYPSFLTKDFPPRFNRIMINSAGFGGNAASLIVSSL